MLIKYLNTIMEKKEKNRNNTCVFESLLITIYPALQKLMGHAMLKVYPIFQGYSIIHRYPIITYSYDGSIDHYSQERTVGIHYHS